MKEKSTMPEIDREATATLLSASITDLVMLEDFCPMNTDFLNLVRYASKAPSGHNTQPWMFRINEETITIIPDFKVSLPVVDTNNRELYISLGCAAENLCIAAGHFGYEASITDQHAKQISIKLAKNNEITVDRLFRQIEKRQTNRSIYTGDKISGECLKQLQSIYKENQIQLYFTQTGTPFADKIREYIMKGNEIQMNDTAFKDELLSWMRFNRKEAETTQNGLSYELFESPSLPKLIAKPIVSLFLNPKKQNRSDLKKIASSSHFVVFTTSHNTIREWIDLGRTLQRFLLKAAETGIACSFLNQPCEIPRLASELRDKLPVNGEYPTLILRIGYANHMPYSKRKEIERILI